MAQTLLLYIQLLPVISAIMFERCLYFNSNTLARKLNQRWEKAFEVYGLSPSLGYLLRLVLEKPGLVQQQLADEMLLERSTIARFIDRLEHRGLVARHSNPEDPRTKVVMPTPEALKLKEELQALGDELYSTMCKKFGKSILAETVKTMREMNDAL